MKKRSLTKSRFKIGAECPTKLYYTDKKEYANKKDQDEFLKALAEGGFQVGELAKLYHPGGVDIDTLDKEEALRRTNELLKQDNAIIYEAAIAIENLFIRVDVLEKKGNEINLIEVKAKSFDSTETFEAFDKRSLKKGQYRLTAKWGAYLLDLAFQTYVMRKAWPKFQITPYLMLADKSKTATVDGIHQLFLVGRMGDGKKKVQVRSEATTFNLGERLLEKVNLKSEIDLLIEKAAVEWRRRS